MLKAICARGAEIVNLTSTLKIPYLRALWALVDVVAVKLSNIKT